MKNKTICVILARKGSKRCKEKNTKPFANKSLTIITAEQALRLKDKFVDIVFSSNDDVAISQVKSLGNYIKIRIRHEKLCTPLASSEDAIADAIYFAGGDYTHCLLLEPTSPLRTDHDVVSCLKLSEETGLGVKSVCEVKNCLSGEIVEPKQQLNGAIHLWLTSWLRDTPYNRFALYEMPMERSIHIDYDWEFMCAELLYRRQHENT